MLLSTIASDLRTEGLPFRPDPYEEAWVIGVLFLSFTILAWVRASHPLKLQRVLDSIKAPHFIRQFLREEHPLGHPASLGLFFLSALTGGLFLYQLNLYYDWDLVHVGVQGFAQCALAIVGGFFLKLLGLALLRSLIGEDPGIREYRFHLVLLFEALGIVLLPITLFIAFLSSVPYLGTLPKEWNFFPAFVLAGLTFLLLLFRAIGIARNHSVPPFYIFLYLCAFEILPLIVLSKAFIDQN